jgi:hypothetical protein
MYSQSLTTVRSREFDEDELFARGFRSSLAKTYLGEKKEKKEKEKHHEPHHAPHDSHHDPASHPPPVTDPNAVVR